MRASLAVEILRHETRRGDAGGATVSGPSGIIDVSHREQRAACSSLWRNKSSRSVIGNRPSSWSASFSNSVSLAFLLLVNAAWLRYNRVFRVSRSLLVRSTMENASRDKLIDSSCFVATDDIVRLWYGRREFCEFPFVLLFICDKSSRNFLTE